jgi:hypothetical protein
MSAVRGRPFQPGNAFGRGRPAGSRNKSTIALQAMLDQHAEPILKKAVVMALQGEKAAIRLCLERLLPVRRHSTVKFKLPRLESVADIAKASSNVVRAVADGKLTGADGELVTSMLEKLRQAFESASLEDRIGALERRHSEGSRDETPTA